MQTLPAFSKTSALVVGAGPTGLTTALLLARYGIDVIVVERHLQRSGQPKAHAINPRSLEVIRQIGLDTAKLREVGVPPEEGDTVRFVVSMNGREHGTLPYERQGIETLTITPEPLFNVPQPVLENFLLEAVSARHNISFHRGVQWENCSQLTKKVLSSKVMDRSTGESKIIESRYILDCGGANSRARDQLGIPFESLPQYTQNEVHHLSVHFNADLRQFKPGTLWWITSPQTEGTFICYDRSNNWVFVTYYNPEDTSAETFTQEYCRGVIDNAIGEKVPYDILSIAVWSTLPRTAEFYQSKIYPHAFVIGDAAHSFPPTGGLGVNTGIADAQNLVWKIHAVEQSWAHERILSTYGEERRPVAIANAHQSVKNQVKLRSLKAALRDPPESESLVGWAEWTKRLDKELENNAEHFDSIGLQIGYVYDDGDILDRPCDHFEPGRKPGSRLPHGWITYGNERISTLDIVDGKGFTLLTSDPAQAHGATITINHSAVPIDTLGIGANFQVLEDSWLDIVGLRAPGSWLLIRPDQHILGSGTTAEELKSLLAETLWPL